MSLLPKRRLEKKDKPTDKIKVLVHGFSVSKAHRAQKCLAEKIIAEDSFPYEPKIVAGVDVAYTEKTAIGAVSVLDYHSFKCVESQTAICEAKVPYFPTLLAYRETPATTACIRKLKSQPDAFLVDGHGIAHPYNCGFASHLGLVIGKPTIGVAKSRLVGEPVSNNQEVLLSYKGKIVGSIVKTVDCAKPVYVSVGHLISLRRAVEIVKHCTRSGRIPEPLRKAHEIALKHKQQLQETPLI